jgi:hypothetical protein
MQQQRFLVSHVSILSVSNLIVIKPAFAQTVPKPAIPTFTLKVDPAALSLN